MLPPESGAVNDAGFRSTPRPRAVEYREAMTRVRYILPVLVLALAAALSPGRAGWAVPSAQDKDSYERLLAILLTGNAENKKTAKDAIRAMGDNGIDLLKADCANLNSVRGALAWSVLKEFLLEADPGTLREFARKNLLDLAKDWNAGYRTRADRAVQVRLKDLVSDCVWLLLSSDKPKDFELLMKALKFSLVVSDPKADFGAEFEVWDRVWKFLNERIGISESLYTLQSWQATLDDHFRRYSLMKGYVDRRAIQAYHTTTLLLMQRIETVKKKPAPTPPTPTPETRPAPETPKPETPAPQTPPEKPEGEGG